MTDTIDVLIYGASDDLVEVEGRIPGADEFNVYGPWSGRFIGSDGGSLIVDVEFGRRDSDADWTIAIRNTGTFPSWPIRFTKRPDRDSDPALIVTVPAGTRFVGDEH
ncbi:hypothetical protein [Curtobacterium sp. MCBD17_040]|uniref:hypothetical protein n=1 Tax=Curtobacterium sp. MCBD17_040 TaxID=2175674 RepID=UPI000DA9C926|nr:hypothetical protein [Curtobacterium sp. MCBD17_040]WIB65421.1 hypothetical protein DEI94_18615 [Curtobacterium sp. MCBD17_040]